MLAGIATWDLFHRLAVPSDALCPLVAPQGPAFGMPGVHVDGMDVQKVSDSLIYYCRAGGHNSKDHSKGTAATSARMLKPGKRCRAMTHLMPVGSQDGSIPHQE